MALFSFNSDRNNNNKSRNRKPKGSIPESKDISERPLDSEVKEDEVSENTESIELVTSEPDYEADYQAYLAFFNSGYHPFPGEPLTLEEFIEVNYTDPETKSNELGFTPGLPGKIIQVGRAAAVSYATDRASRLISAATSGNASDVMSELQDILDTGGNVINVIKGTAGSNDGSSVPPGIVASGGNMKYASHHQLNLEPKPVEVSLNTGIETNFFSPYDLDTVTYFSPMHLSHAKLKFSKLAVNSKMSNYFAYVITFWFQIAAQRNVAFNVNAATNFTTANLLLYLDAITDALQIYYFYTSIITYCSNINNGNAAMRSLRAMMLADDMDYLVMIRDRLARMPIPPNLKTFLFWMNQTYQESSMPGSPIIKTMPMPFATTSDVNYAFTALNSNYVTGVFTALGSDTVNNIANLLAKIVPEWTKQPLDAPSSVALHDPQFTTLFANLPNNTSSTTGTGVRTPQTTSPDGNLVYASYTNGLDGAIAGMFTAYDTSTAAWTPSLVDMTLSSGYNTTRYCQRISYLNGASGKAFYPANTDTSCPMYRGETYYINSAANCFVPFGAEQAYGVNITAVSETGYELLKFLLSLNSLESATGGRSTPSARSNPGKSYGNKNKGKNKGKTEKAEE